MKKYLYPQIYDFENLFIAYKKARKGKTKRLYVLEFKKSLLKNLITLQDELKNQTYIPQPLKTFILRDPKTRKISKSAFRDRIVHHALIRIIEPLFERAFIYSSCANQKGKGNLFALKILEKYKREVTQNLKVESFCLKADIRHYFEEVNHKIILEILSKKIQDDKTIDLIKRVLLGGGGEQKLACL